MQDLVQISQFQHHQDLGLRTGYAEVSAGVARGFEPGNQGAEAGRVHEVRLREIHHDVETSILADDAGHQIPKGRGRDQVQPAAGTDDGTVAIGEFDVKVHLFQPFLQG
jgi:hypothetical protein